MEQSQWKCGEKIANLIRSQWVYNWHFIEIVARYIGVVHNHLVQVNFHHEHPAMNIRYACLRIHESNSICEHQKEHFNIYSNSVKLLLVLIQNITEPLAAVLVFSFFC